MRAPRNCRDPRWDDPPDGVRTLWAAFPDEERLFEGCGGAAIRFTVDAGLMATALGMAGVNPRSYRPRRPTAVKLRVGVRAAAGAGLAFAST